MQRPPRHQTAIDVLRATCGAIINPRWATLERETRDAILEPHERILSQGAAALEQLLREASGAGFAEAHGKLRRAEGFDPGAVDSALFAPEPGPDDEAEHVPRRPFAGGL
jgi:hypothetical protein